MIKRMKLTAEEYKEVRCIIEFLNIPISKLKHARYYIKYNWILSNNMGEYSYEDGECYEQLTMGTIPDRVIEYLKLTGVLYPTRSNLDFFSYNKFKEQWYSQNKAITECTMSDEEFKQKTYDECIKDINDDLACKEFVARLLLDYQSKKRDKQKLEAIQLRAERQLKSDNLQDKLDALSEEDNPVVKESDLSKIDIKTEDVGDMILKTTVPNILFNKKKMIKCILDRYIWFSSVYDSNISISSYVEDKDPYIKVISDKDNIVSDIIDSVDKLYSVLMQNDESISQKIKKAKFCYKFNDNEIKSAEEILINMIVFPHKKDDDEYREKVRAELSKRSVKYLNSYVLIEDNYVDYLIEQARFRLDKFGEDLAVYYLRNKLSESIISPYREDFDIDRDEIFATVCGALGISYSDPNSLSENRCVNSEERD